MKILNFGSLNIDHVYSLDHFPRPGETVDSAEYHIYCGGKGLNQSVAIRRSGHDVYHAGKIGQDGNILMKKLEEHRVNTEYVYRVNGTSGQALIQVDHQGQNAIILHGGANQQIDEEMIGGVIKNFSPGDFLVLQNEINMLDEIVRQGREKEMIIFLNPAPFSESIMDLPLEEIDYLIVNEVEALGIAKADNISQAIERMAWQYRNHHVIVTLGSEGCCHLHEREKKWYGTFQTDVVDTTAAGDTFIGYLAGCLSEAEDVEEAIITATKAAAITISRNGASDSIPDMTEVKLVKMDYNGNREGV